MTRNELRMLMQDKKSIVFLLAGLMKKPSLVVDKEYQLAVDDFPERFHQIVYGAMYNLYTSGVEDLNPIEIDTFLSKYDMQYKVFQDNDGLEVLYKLEEMDSLGNEKNMKYHYDRVKKFSLLRHYFDQGIDTTDIVDFTTIDTKEAEKQNELLDSMSVLDIIKHVDNRIVSIKDKFHTELQTGSNFGDGIDELLDSLFHSPTYGRNLASGLITRIVRGARTGKLYMRSSNTGGGKSRYGLADLMALCAPELWDLEQKKWVKTGNDERGLFITTELGQDELQVPAMCYIAGIPENKVLDQQLSEAEKKRMKHAAKVLKEIESKLRIEHLNDFDIEDIEHVIERSVVKYDIKYVVHDYIFSSMKMMTSMAKGTGLKLREDQLLLLFADKLKQLANKHQIFILTGTQLNDSYKAEGGVNLDASSLRGARALGDKLDVGMIMLRLTPEDEKVIEALRTDGMLNFGVEPTHTVTIFKNRRGELVNVKVWLNLNLGNLRTIDCFVTDMQGRIIDVKPVKVEFVEDEPEYDPIPESFDEVDDTPKPISFS